MSSDKTLTPEEVKCLVRDEPSTPMAYCLERPYDWMIELVLDSDMRPIRWGNFLHPFADQEPYILKNASEGNYTVFVPLEVTMPDLSDRLNFHKLHGKADFQISQHSYQLVIPPVKKPRVSKRRS